MYQCCTLIAYSLTVRFRPEGDFGGSSLIVDLGRLIYPLDFPPFLRVLNVFFVKRPYRFRKCVKEVASAQQVLWLFVGTIEHALRLDFVDVEKERVLIVGFQICAIQIPTAN